MITVHQTDGTDKRINNKIRRLGNKIKKVLNYEIIETGLDNNLPDYLFRMCIALLILFICIDFPIFIYYDSGSDKIKKSIEAEAHFLEEAKKELIPMMQIRLMRKQEIVLQMIIDAEEKRLVLGF